MISKQTRFIGAVLLQLCIILGIVLSKYILFSSGVDVTLQVMPVDPRDALRGDYVNLAYQSVSTVYPHQLGGTPVKNGDLVYVTLARAGDHYIASRVTKEEPKEGTIYLKGRVGYVASASAADRGATTITYGIEQYFIPENTGREMNALTMAVTAKVTVGPKGDASLKQLYINKKPWP